MEKKQTSSTTTVLVVLLVVAAFGIGVLWQRLQVAEQKKVGGDTEGTVTQEAPNPAQPATADDIAPVTEKDHIRGNTDAPLTWIEYSDLQCPFCASIHPNLVRLMDEYEGKIRWVYRHFPLDQIHSAARPSAEAAECVASIGGEDAFWRYVDLVFERQSELTPENVADFAGDIGVNKAQVQACIEAGTFKDRVNEDYNSGLAAGVQGTPNNMVLGPGGEVRILPGALPYDQLKATVEELL